VAHSSHRSRSEALRDRDSSLLGRARKEVEDAKSSQPLLQGANHHHEGAFVSILIRQRASVVGESSTVENRRSGQS
jgi:hypothetical protein